MEPMNATALYTADKCEVWCGTQNGEAALAAAAEASGLPVAKCDVLQDAARRRLRPARPHRLRAAGGADRQADAGHAGQADLVARRGHDALPVPSDHDVQDARRARRPGQSGRPAHAHLRPVDPGLAAAAEPAGRHGPGGVPGPHGERRRGGLRLQRAEPADRPRDAQPAHHGGLLARRQHQPERGLHRMLHGRAGPCGRAGSARVPPQDAEAEMARGAQGRGREGGLRQAAPAGHFHGLAQIMGYGSYVAGVAEVSVSTDGGSRSTGSSRRPTPAMSSTRRRSSGRSRARSSTACRRRCTARSRSRTAPSSRPISTATT